MHKGYFQGILQLRNPNDEVIKVIKKYYSYISKGTKQKNGFDYYFTSNKILRDLGRKLKISFGGILKESPQLYSKDRQTGKAIYRLNVLFKLLDFKKNDIMNFDNRVIKIKNIGKKISGLDIRNNKKTSFKFRNIKKYRILPIIKTRIIKTYPDIEILDENYQPVKTENKKKGVELNEKVKVVFFDGYWLI